MISNFTALILTHFVSDWFFQLDKWGANKKNNFKYLLYHCIQYSILFLPIIYLLNLNMLWVFWLFATHLLIDDYKFVKFWNKHIKRVTPKSNLPPWYESVQDQILHILVLIPVVLIG